MIIAMTCKRTSISTRGVLLAAALTLTGTVGFGSAPVDAGVGAGTSTCFDTGATEPAGVVLNGTAVQPQGKGFLNFFDENPSTDPTENSSVNYDEGANIANGVVTPSETGRICVYNSEVTDVVVDVVGFIDGTKVLVTSDGTSFRAVDTRDGFGKFSPGQTECFKPFSNIVEGQAVVLNGLAAAPEGKGFLNFYPKGSASAPDANSILNFESDTNVANGFTTTTGVGGEVCIYASQRTHVIVDVISAFTQDSYRPANADNSATRVVNTRESGGKVAADSSICFETGAAEGEAVVINGTAVNGDERGYVNLYPMGADDPTANSTINYERNVNIANAVIVPVGDGGKVCAYASTSTHFVADVAGFLVTGVFTPVSEDGSANRVLNTRN